MNMQLHNRCFAELAIGETAALTRQVTRDDAALCAIASGDVQAAQSLRGAPAPGVLVLALISAVLDTRLRGPGTICLAQDLRFPAPVAIDDVLTAELRVMEKCADCEAVLGCRCTKHDGIEVAIGTVRVRADILVVPDLEAGNMLAKQLTFLAGADAAGIVVGARVPIILTSRAGAVRTRLASCAVAMLAARARVQALPTTGAGRGA